MYHAAIFLTVIEVKMYLLSTRLVPTHQISTANYSFSRQFLYRNRLPAAMKHTQIRKHWLHKADVFSGLPHFFFPPNIAFLLMIVSSSRSTLLTLLMFMVGYDGYYVSKFRLF